MKNGLLIAALILGFGPAYAQKLKEADVPSAVQEAFKKQFPGAKVEKWEKEDGNYEAEFEITRISMDKSNSKKEEIEKSVVYTPTGELVQTEEEIKVADLPKAVSDYVTKNLAGKKINEASKIIDANGTVMYEAEVDRADYIFDSNGAFVKKEVENDKDDDDKKEKK